MYTTTGMASAVTTKMERTPGTSNGRRDSRVEKTRTVGKTAAQTSNAVLYLP